MSIIRAPRPESNFYLLNKAISEDKRLGWAERGMLIYLLGKPDHWEINVRALINETAESLNSTGRDAVYKIIGRLIEVGYIRRTLRQGGADYIVHETADSPSCHDPESDLPGIQAPENRTLVSIEEEVRIEDKQGRVSRLPARKAEFPKPDDVDEGTWADFVEVRKAKRAKITQTAINSFRREGTLAGMSLQQVLETICTNGWQGFKAEWVHGKGSKPVAAPLKDWWTKAGFQNYWEAENAGCTERTAHLWANGERKA